MLTRCCYNGLRPSVMKPSPAFDDIIYRWVAIITPVVGKYFDPEERTSLIIHVVTGDPDV